MSSTVVETPASLDQPLGRVIVAAALGSVFEWYDFFLYGSLAPILSRQFFSAVNPTTGFIFALLAFAAGFAVRPLGALAFGRLGDLAGRKRTFLITITVMGLSTALVGVLPGYARWGLAAPMLLIALRIAQGLALGGEYGGAAVYVAEHAPERARGYYTGWINGTATLGLMLSLTVILVGRAALGASFEEWGWRLPFVISLLLLGISVYVRLKLSESPVFRQLQASGNQSRSPLRDSLARWSNLRLVLAALFGQCAGLTVIFYTAHFYDLFFLTQILKLGARSAEVLMLCALALAAPLYGLMGAISDRIGRKPLIVAGCIGAALAIVPIFQGLTHFANPALERAMREHPVVVSVDPTRCALEFDPVGRSSYRSSCDIERAALTRRGVPYATTSAAGTVGHVRVGDVVLEAFEGASLDAARFTARRAEFERSLDGALAAAGYPARAAPEAVRRGPVLGLLLLLLVLASMTYGPSAAWLAELFPPQIRYTSLSVPYHFAVGWFGGFLPAIAFMLVAASGDIYRGLWYPIGVCIVAALVSALLLPETRRAAPPRAPHRSSRSSRYP